MDTTYSSHLRKSQPKAAHLASRLIAAVGQALGLLAALLLGLPVILLPLTTAVPAWVLTTQRFIDDAHALTLYLRDRFKQDKIYVYGVS